MNAFASIKELFKTLNREHELLTELFEKRKLLSFKYEQALEIVADKEERIQYLLDKGMLRLDGAYLELDEQFLNFFEQVLEVNEEINIAFVDENIQQVKQNILYYFQEADSRKYTYLKAVKSSLRKIERITVRNLIDVKRNIENTFKTEPNYKIKIAKLQNYDQKRMAIGRLIEQTRLLIEEEEQLFFQSAMDVELNQITTQLRLQLNHVRHNLIEIQQQIIRYLNQIKYQSQVIEKVRQLKYLKDQFEIRSKTDINQVLSKNNTALFETKPAYPLKLSLDYLYTDDAFASILKVSRKIKSGIKHKLPLAENISNDYIQTLTEEEIHINLEEVRNGFLASGNHLFNFVMQYHFPKEQSFEERITVYCQLVSLYETEFNVTDSFNKHNHLEYAVIFPK